MIYTMDNVACRSEKSSPNEDASPLLKQPIKLKNVLPDINYDNYHNATIVLKKYKIPQLKETLKKFKLPISGKKEVLITRIDLYFKEVKNAIRIQSVYRKWLVSQMFYLRGPAFTQRDMCVNSTDFATLEPVNEIPAHYFYSLTDNNQFTYGFNIASLIQLITQKNNNAYNPYTREKFDTKTKFNIITLYTCCYINIQSFRSENKPYLHRSITSRNPNPPNIRGHQLVNEIIYNPRINPITSDQQLTQFNNIQQLRTTSNQNRIVQLFIAIDQLGNYANSTWFSQLDIRSYVRLYRAFYDIWNFRSGMSREVRSHISPFCNPFDGIFNQRVLLSDLSHLQMQSACLIVFENVIYSGIDEEYKKLGAFHALSALTLVSREARHALPWLYESVMH